MTELRAAPSVIRADYPEPLWVQAVEFIRNQIATGVLKPGMRLPPERELCLSLGISRVTLRKSLGQLVADGDLNASHGRGWYVAQAGQQRSEWPNNLESFTETAERMGLVSESDVVFAGERPANLDEAEQLGIAPGTPLFHLRRVRLLGGVAIAYDVTRIPSSLVPAIAEHDFTVASLYAVLAEAGVEPARAESTIEAREAGAEIAEYLTVAVGTPLLVMHQLAMDDMERPLFASSIQYAGDRYRLRTSFTRSTPHLRRPLFD